LTLTRLGLADADKKPRTESPRVREGCFAGAVLGFAQVVRDFITAMRNFVAA